MSKKLTNKEVLQLGTKLEQFINVAPNMDCFTLYYAIDRNMKKYISERKSMLSDMKRHEKTEEYNKARISVFEDNPIDKLEENAPEEKILATQSLHEKLIQTLLSEVEQEYKEVIEFNNNSWEAIQDMPSDFEIYTIKKDKCIDSKGNPINLNWNLTLMVSDIIVD
jgi:hypothetical protein